MKCYERLNAQDREHQGKGNKSENTPEFKQNIYILNKKHEVIIVFSLFR